jgi:hypothetical protein
MDLEAEDLEERHESTDTDEDEAAEEAQGSKEEGAEEEAHDSNDTQATWHSSQLMPRSIRCFSLLLHSVSLKKPNKKAQGHAEPAKEHFKRAQGQEKAAQRQGMAARSCPPPTK